VQDHQIGVAANVQAITLKAEIACRIFGHGLEASPYFVAPGEMPGMHRHVRGIQDIAGVHGAKRIHNRILTK